MITTTIKSENWIVQCNAIANALKKDPAVVVQDESRNWTAQMIRFTPPTKGSAPAGGKPNPKLKPQALGEKAVKRDVLRSMSPADPEWEGAPEFVKNNPRIKQVVLSGDKIAFAAILKKIGNGWERWRVADFSESLHLNAKGSRGRVHSTKRVFIIGTNDIANFWNYLTRTMSHVGRLKAPFAKAFLALGGKGVSPFVRRHLAEAAGTISIQLEGTQPTITITNGALGVGELTRLANETFRARAEAMKRRCKLILSGYSKDVRDGIIVTRKARGQNAENPF